MGSVKDLKILAPPTQDKAGIGIFEYSDRYSVFDWGEMPDHVRNKGASLCLISAFFFEEFEKRGFKTHYLGLTDTGVETIRLSDADKPLNKMKIKLVRVIEPYFDGSLYDYSPIKSEDRNFLIPLEVIYRFSLPEGSSVFKRIKAGSLKPEDLGLSSIPEPGTVLEKPFIDFSTKLEHYDRYLSHSQAQAISGLKPDKFSELISIATELAKVIKERYETIGIFNEDGKFEFALDENGDITVVDSVGTPDECRFSKNEVTLSKEFARRFYRDTEWHIAVEEAKLKYGSDWREKVSVEPDRLPNETLRLFSEIYTSLANAVIGRNIFPEARDLKTVIEELKEF